MTLQKTLVLASTLTMLTSAARADLACTASIITANQSSVCTSVQIPDHSAVNANLSCAGYKIAINCDLQNAPDQIRLSIASPQGTTVSSLGENTLKNIDESGNGISINCVSL